MRILQAGRPRDSQTNKDNPYLVLLLDPFHKWIVQESFKDIHQGVFVRTQHLHRNTTNLLSIKAWQLSSEAHSLNSFDAELIFDIKDYREAAVVSTNTHAINKIWC